MIRLLFFFILIINSFALADDWGEITELELSQTQRSTSNFSNYWDEHFYGSLSGMTSDKIILVMRLSLSWVSERWRS